MAVMWTLEKSRQYPGTEFQVVWLATWRLERHGTTSWWLAVTRSREHVVIRQSQRHNAMCHHTPMGSKRLRSHSNEWSYWPCCVRIRKLLAAM